jgi:CRP-like cAMP-binding protein
LLIGDHARSADATVSSPGMLLELEQKEFETLVDKDPRLLAHFLRRAIMRVVLNEQSLIGRLRRRNLDLQTALDTLRATTHRLTQRSAPCAPWPKLARCFSSPFCPARPLAAGKKIARAGQS